MHGKLEIPDYPLTQEQIDDYRRNGFIQLDDVITGDVLASMRGAVESAVEQETREAAGTRPAGQTLGTYEKIFNQKVNLWQRHPDVARYTLSRALGSIAMRLEGRPMRLWHDQALFKEPQKGNNKTPWHQDAVYWPHTDRWHQTTVWIALKDATTQNGCMAFVEGTHSLGPLPAVDLADPQDLFDNAPHLRPVHPVPRPLRAGSVTFHNGLTFHYAGPNKSEGTREAFAIIYMPDGTRFDGREHIVTDGQGFASGDALASALFPIVG
jgi:ectoine hydroxylase-related dioxygenase (phytanoyl-CoA dioxygenase family)